MFSKSRKNWSIAFTLVCSSVSSFVRDLLLVVAIAVECGFVVPRPVSSMKPPQIRSYWRRLVTERMTIPMNYIASACMTSP
jgi:hypothetical protein